MTFDPDLINKFHTNLRMAQIHSSGGINETNIDAVMTYMRSALIFLEELEAPKIDSTHVDLSEVLANQSEDIDETGKISKNK